MIKQKFGENTHQHILEMNKHSLKRKNALPLKTAPVLKREFGQEVTL